MAEAILSLNTSGATANNIMTLFQSAAAINKARQNDMADDVSEGEVLSPDELKRRYKEASRLTTGTNFGVGNGHLGTEFRDEIIRRKEQRLELAQAKVTKSKDQQRQLIKAVKKLRKSMTKPKYKQVNKDLQLLIRYKRKKGDKKLPNQRKETDGMPLKVGRHLKLVQRHRTWRMRAMIIQVSSLVKRRMRMTSAPAPVNQRMEMKMNSALAKRRARKSRPINNIL